MDTTTVTSKGQIVIPARIRKRYKIDKGTKICFMERGGELALRPVTAETIRRAMGSVKTGGKALRALMDEKKREKRR